MQLIADLASHHSDLAQTRREVVQQQPAAHRSLGLGLVEPGTDVVLAPAEWLQTVVRIAAELGDQLLQVHTGPYWSMNAKTLARMFSSVMVLGTTWL